MTENEPMDVEEALAPFSTIHVLKLVKDAQQMHGLRHGNYKRYGYVAYMRCTNRYLYDCLVTTADAERSVYAKRSTTRTITNVCRSEAPNLSTRRSMLTISLIQG